MILRLAQPDDARGIHEAHMRSIRELCKNDYSPEQIKAWGGRSFDEEARRAATVNDVVWVIEAPSGIQGYGHLKKELRGEKVSAYVVALYLSAEIAGKGWGKKILVAMEIQGRKMAADCILLHSTITSLSFYRKQGFYETGPMESVLINGEMIPCHPMKKVLL